MKDSIYQLDATNILHEFAYLCAEDSLALVKNPDPHSIAAIKAKRDWLQGKISDKESAAETRSLYQQVSGDGWTFSS